MAPIQFFEAVNTLAKRGDDDFGGIPKWALILLIMLGAGVFVVMLYGVFRFATPPKDDVKAISVSQHDYMREVRARNLNGLLANSAPMGQYHQRASNRSYASTTT